MLTSYEMIDELALQLVNRKKELFFSGKDLIFSELNSKKEFFLGSYCFSFN